MMDPEMCSHGFVSAITTSTAVLDEPPTVERWHVCALCGTRLYPV